MHVYLLCKHPPYVYNSQHHISAAEVIGVYASRDEPTRIAAEKNAKRQRYLWTVKRKKVSL